MSEDVSKQLNNIQAGTDKLKESLQALNKEVPEFADGMEAGLKAVAKALPDVISSIMQLNAQNKQLAADGGKPVSILSQLASGMFSWNAVISIGTTLLVTYGGEIIKWAANMLKGETNMSALTKSLNDQKIAMGALIESQQKGDQNAQQELVSLKLLYTATQNHKLSITERKKAVDQLQKQYPDYFKNLSDETIMAGKAKKAYTDLAGAIIASARAKAAEGMIVTNQQRQLTNEQKLTDLTKKRAEIQKELTKATKDHNDIENAPVVGGGATVAGTTNYDSYNPAKMERLANELQEQDKTISNLNTDSKLLDAKNQVLTNAINQAIEKHGVDTLSKVGGDSPDTGKPGSHAGSRSSAGTSKDDKSKADKAKADEQERKDSVASMAILLLDGYAKEVAETNQHFDQLRELHKGNNATIEQLEKERTTTLDAINQKFQTESLNKLNQYEADLNKTSKDSRQQAFDQLNDDYKKQADDVLKIQTDNQKIINDYDTQLLELSFKQQDAATLKQIDDLKKKMADAQKVIDEAKKVSGQLSDKHEKDLGALNKSFKQEDYTKEQSGLKDDIQSDQDTGKQQKEFADRQKLLDSEKKQALDAVTGQKEAEQKIRDKYATQQKKLDKDRLTAEVATQKQYVQALDSVANAVKGIFGKNTIAAKAAFKAHQAAAAAQVIIDTRQSIMGIWSADSGIPFVGVPKAIAETAIVAAAGASNLATILKQKPGFAQGGQFVSDGRGSLLSGYSRTDNTNAYLRSGEAVVVSEAMRNPWARNLVSAINVAHGGRDFSIANTGKGYAIGGIFTDGGNANRYYNQPMNDAKDLANTMAYQMINNFPPIYVDVKDVNNQQNILAQTVNRVNL